mgnify:CR=1 FL=1
MVYEFLEKHFDDLFNYDYTKNMEDTLDEIAKGAKLWHSLCQSCYDEMTQLSKKISNPSCGILLDDNVLQSCGQCDAYTSKDGCPAPWGSSKSDLENPNIDFVKKSYGCSFTDTNNLLTITQNNMTDINVLSLLTRKKKPLAIIMDEIDGMVHISDLS